MTKTWEEMTIEIERKYGRNSEEFETLMKEYNFGTIKSFEATYERLAK